MMQEPSKCCLLLIWFTIGVLTCGVALATLVTLYIIQQSSSTTTTTISTTVVTSQIQTTQTSSSASTVQKYFCGGSSSYTLWQTFGSNGITMVIDTSACNFTSTPFYFTSISGTTNHWALTGYGAIYLPTKSSFTIYAQATAYPSSTVLFSLSQTDHWGANWFGLSQ